MAAPAISRTFAIVSPPVSGEDVREFQQLINQRFSAWRIGRRVSVNGVYDVDTRQAVIQVCTGLGIQPEPAMQHGVTPDLRIKIRHPERRSADEVQRSKGPGASTFRARLRKQFAPPDDGTVMFDGHPVAAWIVPSLEFARAHGWSGQVISGFRTCAEQMTAAAAFCKRQGKTIAEIYPNGPCASNHCGSAFPKGAVDVTQPVQLAQALIHSPHTPTLVRGVVIDDGNHFSHDGH